MESPLRLFAALPLPEELVNRLVAVQRALDRHWPARSVRWVRPDQLHLTLRFYGNVAPADASALAEALRGACAGTGPLGLRIGGLGGFPNTRQPRVIWAGVSGDVDSLARLQEGIEAATGTFGDSQEDRMFQPHLTLGRLAFDRRRRPALPTNATWTQTESDDLGGWTATAVHLIRSQLDPAGARYTVLNLVPLPGERATGSVCPEGNAKAR